MKKYGFVYLWYDKKRKMYYVGCHYGTEFDGYICSSNRMRDAHRRRPQDFKRRILKTNILTKKKTLDEEYKWLQLIFKQELGKKYYNLHNHQCGLGPDKHSEETIKLKKNQIPWNKGLTKETNNIMLKISIANTGKHLSKETKQKLREARAKQTIILTEETKKKISIANTGKHHSKETRKRISEGHKGQIAWNKGLTKNNDIRIANYSIKLLGNLSWNKGKRLSDEHRKKLSILAKERHKNGIYIGKCMTGKHHSEETKEKLRQIAFSIRKLNHDCSGEMFS